MYVYTDQQHNGVRCGNIRLWSLNTDGFTSEVYHSDFVVRVKRLSIITIVSSLCVLATAPETELG